MSMEKWKKGVSSLILWVASFQTSGTILSKTLVERIEYQLRQWHYATIMKHVERAVGWWNKRTPTKNCLRKNIIYIIYNIYNMLINTISLYIYIYICSTNLRLHHPSTKSRNNNPLTIPQRITPPDLKPYRWCSQRPHSLNLGQGLKDGLTFLEGFVFLPDRYKLEILMAAIWAVWWMAC